MNLEVHVPTRTLLLQHPDPFAIREVVQRSRTLDHGEYNLAVRHDVEETRILRNMGIEAPSPICTYYKWSGRQPPWDHQRLISEFMTMHFRCFNLSEMGTGKTRSALWAADWLMLEGKVRKALIICPLSLTGMWREEVYKTVMHRTAAVVHGTRQHRIDMLKSDVDFYILNKDGCAIEEVHRHIHNNPEIDLVIVDEGSNFSNHLTDMYRGLEMLLRPDMRVWWMTGTPCANSPAQVWAQAKIIAPERVPKHFGGFRRAVMSEIELPKTLPGGRPLKKYVPRAEGYELAYSVMQPAIRLQKKDCLTLPPLLPPVSWVAPLTPEQKRAFKAMQDEMLVELKSGVEISAVNAADKLSKLRQILCGGVRLGDESYTVLPHQPRTKLVLDAIEQAQAKTLVIVPFKGILRSLATEIGKTHSVGVLNGDVSLKERESIIHNFKHTSDPQVLLCHPKVMAHGLNLVEADMLVFYAPIFSNDEYQQVVERFNRAGQVNVMNVVHIGAHPVEWEIYKTLDSRAEMQSNVLRLYKIAVTQGGTDGT